MSLAAVQALEAAKKASKQASTDPTGTVQTAWNRVRDKAIVRFGYNHKHVGQIVISSLTEKDMISVVEKMMELMRNHKKHMDKPTFDEHRKKLLSDVKCPMLEQGD